MKCFSCKIEIPSSFTFALAENKCPGCGKEILDEETQALKSDIIGYVGSSIALKQETLDKLAMMLISRYDIQSINGSVYQVKATQNPQNSTEILVEEEVVDAKEQAIYDTDEEIRKLKEKRAAEIRNKDLDELKDEALKEALQEKYNLSFQENGESQSRPISNSSPTDFNEDDLPPIVRQKMNSLQQGSSAASQAAAAAATAGSSDFGDINPILEAARLKKQVDNARAMDGGGNASFRRTV